MPKSKATLKRKPQSSKSAAAKKKIVKRPTPAKTKPIPEPVYSDEYREYLQRYAATGGDRPRLSSKEFDRLDDELLDLLALEAEVGLDDEQIIRLQELEYLLLDSEQ
ncbi:MAG: hypothetical protein AB1817_12585 [Chloroflexota bacterium]